MILLDAFLIFSITVIVSFIGSVQLGPVNITVIRTSMANQFKSALFIGLGGALPELLYSAIALEGAVFLEKYPSILQGMMFVCIPLFIGLGIYLLIADRTKKSKNVQAPMDKEIANHSIFKSISIGFGIGILNPMLLPFWMVVLSTYHQYNLMIIPSYLLNISFVLGTAVGAFLLQYSIVLLLKKYAIRFEKWILKYANPITAWMFIILGIFQLISVL